MTGAAYEIGALTALDRLFAPGFSSSCFDVYVGTSAGSIPAALMANRTKPEDISSRLQSVHQTIKMIDFVIETCHII